VHLQPLEEAGDGVGGEAQGPEEGGEGGGALALVSLVHPCGVVAEGVAAGGAAVALDEDLPDAQVAEGFSHRAPALEAGVLAAGAGAGPVLGLAEVQTS
jgi:hypothetical protein